MYTLLLCLCCLHPPCNTSNPLWEEGVIVCIHCRPDTMAGPLIDGMVVSRRSLSALVRQTTLNMCQRHRMENEG